MEFWPPESLGRNDINQGHQGMLDRHPSRPANYDANS